MNLKGLS